MSAANPSSRDSVVAVFEDFRVELDAHNDRRERLIKSSRDITNLSKKVIFLLHRLIITRVADEQDGFREVARQGRAKLVEIQALFAGLKGELDDGRFWRYERSVSSGLQEYIEALSFTHYLEHGTLVTFTEVQDTLCDEHGVPYFPLPLADYLLGLSDLTGELMRFAITAISLQGGRKTAQKVCDFVRNCKADFEGFTPYINYLSKKQAVTAQSLLKIEDAAYAIAVRSSEYAGSEAMLGAVVDQYVSAVGLGRSQAREDWHPNREEDRFDAVDREEY